MLTVAAFSACGKDATDPGEPIVTALSCDNGSDQVACTLDLQAPAGFKVRLESSDCRAHGNIFRITAPIEETLFTDGCYETVGKETTYAGPFPTGTSISAEVIAPNLGNAPSLLVTGEYPEWTLKFEDGEDDDHNDLILVLTALPQDPTP
jgi:hypothetical protein